MKEAFTKENIENWLVEFLTSPLVVTSTDAYPGNSVVLFTPQHRWKLSTIYINPPGAHYARVNIFYRKITEIGESQNIQLDYFPKRALALLAIIHRPAYEIYKQGNAKRAHGIT